MLKVKLQYYGPPDERSQLIGKDLDGGRRRSGQERTRSLNGIIDSMDMHFSKCQEIVEDRGACHAAINVIAKSQIQLSN